MSESKHAVRFPGESAEYRSARDALLDSEIELRRATEAVAAKRRVLPLGGEVTQDYLFEEPDGDPSSSSVKEVRLSDLFSDGKDTLILYSFMYGPEMKEACPSCTSILDSLDGAAPHVTQRVNLAVAAKSPVPRIMHHARKRGWHNLRLISSGKSSYNADYQGENSAGEQTPMLNVFVRRDGRIHHTWASEMMLLKGDPGQDPRHVDMIWPIWSLFDVTPEGRGEKWSPRLSYD